MECPEAETVAPKAEFELAESDNAGDEGPDLSTRGARGMASRSAEKDGALFADFGAGGEAAHERVRPEESCNRYMVAAVCRKSRSRPSLELSATPAAGCIVARNSPMDARIGRFAPPIPLVVFGGLQSFVLTIPFFGP